MINAINARRKTVSVLEEMHAKKLAFIEALIVSAISDGKMSILVDYNAEILIVLRSYDYIVIHHASDGSMSVFWDHVISK